MGKTLRYYGRTAPFISMMGFYARPACSEPRGHWPFDADDTEIELRSCEGVIGALCCAITRIPKSAATLPAEDRKALCGVALLCDLQPDKAQDGELARLDGWVIDIDAMTPSGKAPRYAARFVVLSETRARLNVQNAFGIVIDGVELMRAAAPIADCK